MLFKGTKNLSAQEISYTIESMGGTLEGFTSRDFTGIYARVASEHLPKVIELLCEITSQPEFDEEELEKEKRVVKEEIKSSVENPQDLVVDLLFETLYHPHPLGFPITGKESTVDNITKNEILSYYKSHYTLSNIAVVGVGGLERGPLMEGIKGRLSLKKGENIQREKVSLSNRRIKAVKKREISQVYMAIALPTFGFRDNRRYTLSILSTALAGGMSSRLFIRLREDEGLVYSVSSFTELFEDTGFLCICFITDKKNLDRVMGIILREMEDIKKRGFKRREFLTAKNLTIGSMLLGLENPTSRMLRMAKHIFSYNRVIPIEKSLKRYQEVDEDKVMELIEEVFPFSHLYLSAVGPVEDKELERFLR